MNCLRSTTNKQYSGLTTLMMQAMHAGVERDEEKQRIKRERMADFEMQRRLEEEYRKIQHVSDGNNGQSSSSVG